MKKVQQVSLVMAIAAFLLLSWMPVAAQVNWTQMEDPLLNVGPAGSWESEAVLHPVVRYFDSTYHMWYSGRDENNKVRIGYATSADGLTWERYANNPVLDIGEPGAWDDNVVTGPVVVRAGNKFHLWYWGISVSGNVGSAVGHAISPDGIHWVKDPENPVIVPGGPDEWDYTWTATGGVLYDAPYFRMWYSAVGNLDLSDAGIGLAISRDGTHWKKHPANPLMLGSGPPAWDNTFVYNPMIIKDDHIYHMWFHGAWPFQIGYATSLNGLDWRKHQSNPMVTNGPPGAWDELGRLVPAVVLKDGQYQMWHTGIDGAVDTFLIGYATAPLATPEPLIVSVEDIPDDQGNQVRVIWNASIFDGIYRHKAVATYSLWRQVDELAAASYPANSLTLSEAYSGGGVALHEGILWDFVAEIPPHQFARYGYVAPTLAGVANGDTTFTTFMVSAHGTEPGVFWNSLPVSGYSEDNLAPAAPQNLAGAVAGNGEVLVSWAANQESDFRHFAVYRSQVSGFEPGNGNLVITTRDTSYIDAVGQLDPGAFYYRLAAVDSSGNRSELSNELAVSLTGIAGDAPVADHFTLFQNYPNPFNPATTIDFNLPVATGVRLTVYNVLGEEIRVLIDGQLSAGKHGIKWDGRDLNGKKVPSGIYIYHIEAGVYVDTRKMTLLQ